MNSQIFPSNQVITSGQIQQMETPLRPSTTAQWLSAIMLIAVVILFPERPAWGEELDIQAGPAIFTGVAHHDRLGDVLEVPADETGHTVYPDKALPESSVPFHIPHRIPAQKAIQKYEGVPI